MKILKSRVAIITHDLIMSFVAWQLAWLVRFNFSVPQIEWDFSLSCVGFVVIIQAVVNYYFGLYRGIWRFASLLDLKNILLASLVGMLCITCAIFVVFRLDLIPRSIFVLFPVFLIGLLGGPRFMYRLYKDSHSKLSNLQQQTTVLIIGAGRAGEMLARDMLRSGQYLPVGFIDDNPRLLNSEIHGVRVLATTTELLEQSQIHNPDCLVIAIPSISSKRMQEIASLCEDVNLPIRTLPNINDMVSGKVTLVNELRELSIEDLLGRDKVELNWEMVNKSITGKVVMITGGGGSIGSVLCHQIAELGPAKLIVYDNSELNLYKINEELSKKYRSVSIKFVLGDVCDALKSEYVVKEENPNFIFHAAAYKHVPILETDVYEAVRNNIFGTMNMINLADKYKCEKFVFISTDKAVNPANILGVSKRIAEMMCENKNKGSESKYITVRFGNVLGSNGSVVPLFKQQIKKGGPVTLTHRDITRYFMTIPEASQLILQATAMGNGGEIYVLDMGDPIKISFLAEQMIKLSGLVPEEDIDIEVIGLRPGEKLYEELFYEFEKEVATEHKKIRRATHPEMDFQLLNKKITELEEISNSFDTELTRRLMREIIDMDLKSGNEKNSNVLPLSK
jgi:FlaA1/EpsC-like NDP-sugar epimerase